MYICWYNNATMLCYACPAGGFPNSNLNQTVPPRMTPTETMQRNAGHIDQLDRGLENMYLNEGKQLHCSPTTIAFGPMTV